MAVQRRGRRALERFTVCNMRLAHKVAARFRNRGVPLEDLVQAATLGLHQAYLRFKPQYGYRSSSYAIWFAQQACQVAVGRQASTIVLPATISEQIRRIHRAGIRLAGELNRPPTEAEIADGAGLTVKELRAVQRAAQVASTRSLDAPIPAGDGAVSLMALIATEGNPEEDLHRRERRRALLRHLATCPGLTPQQRYILQCRYLMTPAPSIPRLASQLQMSRQLLRDLEAEALRILRARSPIEIQDWIQTC
jgi:RNA polymerase sigma factor (sigma-70 family)